MKDNIATVVNSFNCEAFSEINTLQSLTPSELFWYQRITALQPLQLPFDIPHKIAEPRWAISRWQSPSPQSGQEEPWRIVLQAFVIYLARLTQQPTYQIGWGVALNDNRANLASVVPMDIAVALDQPWCGVADTVDDELARLAQHQTFSYDRLSHLPSLYAIPELSTHYPWSIAVSVIQDDRQCDQKASGELLTLQINEQGGFRWIYDENRLSAEVIARMDDHLQALLISKERSDDIPIGQLNLLQEAERTLLLETWNLTETLYPEVLCIHQWFEQQVQKTPQATALEYQGQTLSYTELNARANRLAHQLIEQGIEPEQRVVICVARSPAMVVSLLAVLKAGGAYVPLDITYPAERLAYVLNDSAPSVILADDTGQSILGDEVLAELTVLDPTMQPDQPDSNPQVPTLTPQHLAYVIYTSGSTGTPKGVMVEHQAIYQRTLGVNERYGVTAQDRVLQFAAFAFDVAVEECFSSLCYGATLVIRDNSWLDSMTEFIALARENRITVMLLPTLFWSELAAREPGLALPDSLRLIIIGSEAVQKKALQDWFAQVGHRPRLLNAYGPTENTVTATCQEVFSPDDDRSIGRPLKNTRIYLLDSNGQPVPLGCAGEIYIGGVGVARGYLNQPILSEERFIPDPFSSVSGARMYRTGDVARYLPDGNLEFLGRNDQQVKIRGFRVELGEIETRLLEHPAVNQAAVLARDDGQSRRLVAYIVTETVMAEENDEWVNSLRTHLSALLPDYMMPAAFMRLDSFPQTPNGKLDRRALPAPDEEAFVRQAYEAPQGREETILATVWGELLGIEPISRHDSFFALGGHSLLAMRMIEYLRQQGLALAASDLFRSPVLSDLAKMLGQHQTIEIPPNVITPVTQQLTPAMLPLVDLTQADIDHIVEQVPGGLANIQDIYALSPLQDGILFHHLLAQEGDPYLLTVQMIFADRSLLDRYLAVMQRIVDRHDILRTAFIWQGISVPAQVVCRHASLSVTELTLEPANGPVIDQLSQRFDPRHYRLDLDQAPLLHFVVAQETDGRWFLLELHHHLIGDHEALEMMHREVQLYLTGQEESLPVPVPFRNLVAQSWLGMSQEADTAFFTEMLAEVEEPTLPFGLTEVHRDGSQVTESHQMLTPELNNRLRSQARQLGVSLAALCHLAWAQVLSRVCGQEKVVFGTVLFGRMTGGEGTGSGMGLFINTLPLRLDMDDIPVRDSVQAAHRRLAGLLAHEHASLALAQQCSGVDRGTPLFSALLNYRHNVLLGMSGELVSGIEFVGEQERTNYPFVLSVEDLGDALGLTAQVVQPFEPERVCGYMQQALESLADALEQAPETPVRQLNILPEAERTLLLSTWNTTETAYPEALCIHQWFEQQVAKTPQATALVYENQTLSYAELNARANRLAYQLMALGVEPEQRVAICVARSPAMVVGVLAVLKAGGAYVPLDPAYPGERLADNLRDTAPAVVLADSLGRSALGEHVLAERNVLDPNTPFNQPDSNPQILVLTSRHLAYVIYTSGSTGTPKGVMVEHRGLVNLIQEKITQFAIGAESRVLQFASLSFDASVWEMMMALCSGAALAIPAGHVRQNPTALWHYLEAQAITHACLPPALLHDRADIPALTVKPTLILGGEAPSTALIQALCGRVTLFNAYGPTEITVCATVWPCPSDYTDTGVPIGRPTANTQIYLLDEYGQPVPLGAVGELYIGGVGVARGYLNRPELTAERFLVDPFSDSPDARMYRSGDLARYRPDGNLEFLGRNDQQVKIRGFRIEPGEIEARLAEHSVVRESVVLAQGEGQDRWLVAYVVTETVETETKAVEADEGLANSLRVHLSARLPDYMVPAAFVRLDAFPLTPNGKLDRRALPAPDNEAFARRAYEAPQGETENALAAIWREVLGIESISRHDNFFALGGHSLLAVRVMNRLAALGIELPLPVLFSTPSLAALAEAVQARIDKQDNVVSAIMPVSREGILPLSFAQQRLWFLTQFEGVSETYHIPIALRLRGQLDIVVWQQALNTLFARHEALRSVFVSVDGQPQIRLLAADHGLSWVQHDLRRHPDAEVELERLCAEEMSAPFELNRGPLIRAMLIRLADDDYQFLLTQHHIVSDGWSVNVLIQELSTLYTAFLDGQPDPLAPLAIQYPDYAVWQRQWLSADRIQVQSDYWRTMLADAPVLLDLPTDRPRPSEQSFAGHVLPINLDAELTSALKRLSEQHGVTLFMTLLSAWAVVLSRLSGQTDIVIGTPSAGRNRQEVEPLIGFFVNTLALRMGVSGELTVAELLAQVRETALGAQAHQDLPFEQVVEIVQLTRRLDHTPLFQVMFSWENNEHTDWTLPGLTVSPADQDVEIVKFDLELGLFEENDKIAGELSYATALFDQTTMERHIDYLHTVLQAMVANAQRRIGDIDILTPAERQLLLETWNATETPYPDALCIHQLFEQQAEKNPEAMALEYQGQTLSYAELNARANRLAHQLIEQGIEPDQRVVICVARSPAMVVSLLAVLKAGGAYVPLDITYPPERLAYILSDSAPSVVVADRAGQSTLSDEMLAGLTVLDPTMPLDQPDSNPQVSTLTPQHLAYVIYTSGSTGTPKGVMVEHQAIYHRTLGVNERYGVTAQDRVLQFAAFAFDVAVEECFSSLCNGATLVIRDDSWLASMAEFITLTGENRITVLFLPTLFWSELAGRDKGLALPDALRLMIIGSEAVQKKALQDWFAQGGHRPRLLNAYGPTENTVTATCQTVVSPEDDRSIGRPLSNTRIYLLDSHGQPVPLGGVGEIYIGGVGVARGYLNQPILSEERFISDPFSQVSDARMYRTGDMARYLPDGNLEFLGRNDQQVKIRGFRIEPGEIETRLLEYPAVQEAVVLARDDGQGKRLVAYVVAETGVAEADKTLVNNLRTHLSAVLPDYMVPAAFVRLDSFPQTPNGKLDRRALPAPDGDAFARQTHAAPQGETEMVLAAIWRELLGIESVSRHDSFFALGGHSLLAVRMVERLRQQGVALTVRDLFRSPVLSDLAKMLGQHRVIEVPPNVITPATQQLTPAMLPLVDLTQADIDHIIEQVPGGVENIQDIYALSPLQDGILFHHLLAQEGDTYLLSGQMAFADRALLDRYLATMQRIVDRHDILRTAFVWQGISVPVQVVWRHAPLSVTELTLDPADGPVIDQLSRRFDPRHYRLDLGQAPLLHFVVAQETDGRWFLLELHHHLIGDHETLEVMHREVQACLTGQEASLPAPVPFRNLVAQVRLGVSQAAHTRFFTDMLAEVAEPTLPFGLADVHLDGSQEREFFQLLTPELNDRLRHQARQQGVSLAALCHLAWAQVLARSSGQEKVVFGTVLFGRMTGGEGTEGGMGLFINTLPLRLDIDDTPVQDSVQAAHHQLAGLLVHEHASLALAQQCSGIERGTPLFSALLNYRHNSLSASSDEPFEGIEFLDGKERTNYPFGLSVEDFGNALGLTASVVPPFEPERIWGYMQQALESLVDALEHTPAMPVRALDILPEAERTLLLTTWNRTETPYPAALCIHQWFEQQAEKTPEAIALEYQGQTLSYVELNARANRLAHQLIELGVGPEQRVAICVTRSPAMVISLLAVLKAGGAYVPLDITYPAERLAYILSDSAPSVILADDPGQSTLSDEMLAGLTVLDLTVPLVQPDSNPQVSTLTPQHLAYVIYTSGSTGTPKGVMVEHQAIYQRTLGVNERYGVTAQDRVLQFAAFAFDVAVEECFSSLCNGATLVIRDDSWLASIPEFIALARENRITVLLLPTLFWSELAGRDKGLALPDALRLMIIGSEAVQKKALQDWFAQAGHRPRLLNAYGPTENTVTATCQEVFSPNDDRVIGRPLKNTRIYLLDSHGQPVPLGSVGEIYIGGVGVARGYLNQPILSEERFISDPFSQVSDARMYRTGDMARYLPDGNLEFLGRNDQQVKIRGFRIEPGEIETRLLEYPAVQEAVVLARDDGQGKRLVAYVVAETGVAEADETLVNNLRTHLSVVLPDYMVPAAFVRLDSFPQTPNGKLDRRALPAPDGEAFARQAYEAPQGATEMTLAAIWGELLGIESISRHDSFFALGGHSLLAVRMIERLRQQGLALMARELFRSPVLSDLAKMLGQHQTIEIPPNVITPATQQLTPAMLPLVDLTQADIDHIVRQVPGGVENIQDIYALSPLQDGILFHHLLVREGDTYLLSGQMAFADRSLLDRYLAAMQRIVDRHDILRTAFIWQGISVPVQVVWRHASLSVTELTLDPADGPVIDQLSRRFDRSHYRLDLGQAPLLHFVVAQETDGRWFLLELHHHMIGDHETVEVMHREVQACLTGQEASLPAPVPFRNLVAQVRLGVSQAAHTRFFTEMLADVAEPTLPFGLADVHLDGSQEREFYRLLTPELNDRLRHQARQQGVSLAALCHLAWAQVLARSSGQEKVVFGTVLFGRMAAGEGAGNGMGLFINTLPLRLDMDDTPVQDSVQTAHRRLAGLLTHEHASLALAQQCSGVERGTPLFSALLNYRHNTLSAPSDEPLAGIEFLDGEEGTNYPFGLSVEDFGDALGLTASVVLPFEPERICGYMQQALESLVDALEHTPAMPVRELDILPQAERTLLLTTWNTTETPYPPAALCIHQWFEQQVQNTPDATALEYQGQTLSYSELNACANRLAHQLIESGVGPEQRVAICVARSPAMVVSLLAVLKAGGAYVPLDTTYPAERLTYILSDSAPSVVVADRIGQAALSNKVLAGLTVLDPTMPPDQPDSNPQVSTLTPQHLAYVIYTSGSTGTPKGVMVEHQAIYQRTLGVNERYGVTAQDRVLQFAAFAFDVAVEECFSSLCNGATLVIRDDSWLASIPEFITLTGENRITVLFLPTLFWSELAGRDKGLALPDALRLMIIGSEAVQKKALQDWFAQGGHRPRLLNAYGPTENTVTATCQTVVSPEDDRSIGRPLSNTRIYLLDSHGQPVPLGSVGEIYIGGVGVARGYLNQPILSEERFIPDPFSPVLGARMYRTGDMARYLPNGSLEFFGRNDQQVKIRGFRIEPGEIETRLLEHPAVQEAVVLALDDGQGKRLVAYIVAAADEALVNNLRTHLSAILPDYMVPAAFVCLDSFPQTPNGKLDRRALPAPDGEAFARQIYEAPHGEMEIALAAIWREVLGIEQISRHDNFFALGGHSLLAMQVMNRIAVLGGELPLSELFSSPSLAALAEKLHIRFDQQSTLPPILPVSREGGLPLSFVQERMWLLTQFRGASEHYNMPLVLHLRGQLDIAAWQQALDVLFARHEALRSVFVSVDGQPQVRLLVADRGLPLVYHDLRGCPDAETELKRLRTEEVYESFDLSQGPLVRTMLIRLADDDYQFLLTQHHIISDGWSVKVLIDELNSLYTAFLSGQPDPLPVLAIQYPDYAAWQRQWFSSEHMQAQVDYWRTTLADAPALLNLPTDRPRPLEQSFVGQILPINLDVELITALKRLSAQHNVTLFMTLLSAWTVVLSRLSGQEDIIVGTHSSGRSRQEVEPLIGFFVNTLSLRTRVSGELTVAELLAQVRQTTLAAQAHQDLPFEQMMEIVQPSRQLDHIPLCQAVFAWQDYEDSDWTLPGLTVSSIAHDLNITNYDLEIEFFEENGIVAGAVSYATALFDQSTIERHIDYLLTVLQTMVDNPQQRIREIDILISAEQ
ncbi:amino acid adenylation domain-containing protein [Xenorhabdus budapestensis]|uniref:Amino acid adenylation domain-containing protein n=1 Tax=Xenorhabdus budapestensis TaxID=290110 RepID=A0ABX7VEE3_XENBU|nr:non-ribosomal peptide synthetase [Xenorhabdus budapestensis]QTL38237.1 amino acid adenylation domain-containing protein [Xenorhabdus budapestensis]